MLKPSADAAYRERLARWMRQRGFATGTADSFEELLGELSWQVNELSVDAARHLGRRRNSVTVVNSHPRKPFR